MIVRMLVTLWPSMKIKVFAFGPDPTSVSIMKVFNLWRNLAFARILHRMPNLWEM